MRKFECHITMPREHGIIAKKYFDGVGGWKYSQIDGDAIMGAGAKAYLTRYDTDGGRLLADMKEIAVALRLNGVDVLREKVEEIIYDSKTGHNVIVRPEPICASCGSAEFQHNPSGGCD